ncbi:hypothetical protein [Paenirhodobacter populi]|uniref:hypothetical protein n=1 Tax=Paenirhodobacter populi TaxID=2306993 RepID=UPI000FE3726B|nr:hypothetical protein [Sinirhodobacter populi]RWR07712.1 hypothetical protein D2T32_11585 [Sinirhodobacter populi]
MTDTELDEILTLRWPAVVRRAMMDGDDFSRNFTRSIARQGKRPNWRPSAKQEYFMRRLLAEVQQQNDTEWSPIEEDQHSA